MARRISGHSSGDQSVLRQPSSRFRGGEEGTTRTRLRGLSLNLPSQILWKLVPMWTKLRHQNIAAFRGVVVETDRFRLALVYDWEENGNIVQYTASHPEVPRLPLVPDFLVA